MSNRFMTAENRTGERDQCVDAANIRSPTSLTGLAYLLRRKHLMVDLPSRTGWAHSRRRLKFVT